MNNPQSSLSWIDEDPLASLRDAKLARIQRGEFLLDLSMINPDLEPPRFVLDRLVEASLKSGQNRYAVSRGIRKLREGFSHKYNSRFGVSLDPEHEICAVMGTKDALLNVFSSETTPQDTILVGAPTYPLYLSAAKLCGLRCETFAISSDTQEMLADIEMKLVSTHAKVLLLNFPNNPTGICVDDNFYQQLALIAERHNVLVVNDFVYGELGFSGNRPASLLRVPWFKENAVEIYSLSKAYSIPGWRVGAICGKRDVIANVARLKSLVDYGIFLPIQNASAAALCATSDLTIFTAQRYEQRCRSLVNGLTQIGWEPANPSAGVCVWSKLPEELRDLGSLEACKLLLAESGVLCTPGILYGEEFNLFVRFALVASEDRLVDAVERIERVCAAQSQTSPAPARIAAVGV